ncbi:hypothetical protein GCM10027085_19040 [Spirosoma aerophilum]
MVIQQNKADWWFPLGQMRQKVGLVDSANQQKALAKKCLDQIREHHAVIYTIVQNQ